MQGVANSCWQVAEAEKINDQLKHLKTRAKAWLEKKRQTPSCTVDMVDLVEEFYEVAGR